MFDDRWTMWSRLCCIIALLALGAQRADAGARDVAEAEHVRLSEEMNNHAGKGRWHGVERAYVSMEALVKKDVLLTYRDHYQGAQAARELGNINHVYQRLRHAKSAKDTDDVQNWLKDIRNNYGQVELVIPRKWKGDVSLSILAMPLFPDQRSTIGLAQARVQDRKSYNGLLPVGDYQFAEQSFTVVAGVISVDDKVGGDTIRVELGGKGKKTEKAVMSRRKAGEKAPFRFTYVGPRADIGLGWTQGADASGGGVQPGGFGGPGARLGGGLELGVGGNWGVIAQVGYHNLFGSPSDGQGALEDKAGFTSRIDALHMGYGWLAGTMRLNDLWLAAGPLYAVGSAGVTGVNGLCLETPNATECRAVGGAETDTLRFSRMTGKVRAGGAAVGASWSMWTLGSLEAALSLNMGAQSDMSRWYPWTTLAITVAPSGPEDDG